MNRIILAGLLKNFQALIDPRNLLTTPKEVFLYFKDLKGFKKEHNNRYPLKFLPILYDRKERNLFDPQYVYQAYWATKRILSKKPIAVFHLDISSSIPFFVQLSAVIPVFQMEYQSPKIILNSCIRISGNILNLPFADESVKSLSCLHVVEHVGLGRYGDPIDANGMWKALAELGRVVAPEGDLYLTLPVGISAVYFNAGCIFRAQDIVGFFSDLDLMEFSCVDDSGRYMEHKEPDDSKNMTNALGLFHFRKPAYSRSTVGSLFDKK